MADKFLIHENGTLKEKVPVDSSVGAGDAGKIAKLNAQGKWDETMMPTGIGAEVVKLDTSDELSAGDFVNLYFDAPDLKIRKADASNGRRAHGFVKSAFGIDDEATVYFGDDNDQLSGLTMGSMYYLSASSAGGVTSVPPNGSGDIVQELGIAINTTAIQFQPGMPIELA